MTRRKRPWKPSRRERRVLLALLSGAGNLSSLSLARAAQVTPGRAHRVLGMLSTRGWAVSEQETRTDGMGGRWLWSLTRRGRLSALALLGLEEKR